MLDGKAYQFVATQKRLAGKHGHGFRYTVQDKSFAASLYNCSPKLYRILHKSLNLPYHFTLQCILFHLGLKPAFNTAILESLQKKVKSMKNEDRLCSL